MKFGQADLEKKIFGGDIHVYSPTAGGQIFFINAFIQSI